MPGDSRLLDTGPLVAFLAGDDAAHARCVAAQRGFGGTLLSTEAVLTEALYLLGDGRGASTRCIEMFLRGDATLIPMNNARLIRCRELMAAYADVPMDFADATLVALAEETGVGTILTLDRRDFSIYRFSRNRSFKIIP